MYITAMFGSILAVWICGMIWRWSEAGQYASGDDLAYDADAGPLYQISNGQFIKVMSILNSVVVGLKVCCCCCGLLANACK